MLDFRPMRQYSLAAKSQGSFIRCNDKASRILSNLRVYQTTLGCIVIPSTHILADIAGKQAAMQSRTPCQLPLICLGRGPIRAIPHASMCSFIVPNTPDDYARAILLACCQNAIHLVGLKSFEFLSQVVTVFIVLKNCSRISFFPDGIEKIFNISAMVAPFSGIAALISAAEGGIQETAEQCQPWS